MTKRSASMLFRTATWLAAAAMYATLAATSAQAGITNTKHNLSSTSTSGNNQVGSTTANNDEICVFCHTPHGSNTAVAAPLWNKRLPGTTYTTYTAANSSTLDGEVLSVGSVSLACLSCHDGAQAMDNIINAPGSGGYDVTGGGAAGLGRGVAGGYTWTGDNQTAGKMINTGDRISMLGSDLTNDHPVGVQYCGGGITGDAITGCRDGDFKGGTGNAGLATASLGGTQVWWVDTAFSGTREKTDMILFTRTTFSAGSGPSVECASCHDPHSDTNPTFLRVSNTGSGVCLSCHVK